MARWDSQVHCNFPVQQLRAVRDGKATGEVDNPLSTEKRTEERNLNVLRGEESGGELDARLPRVGEGLSEAAGSVARGIGELVEAVGHAAKRVTSLGEDERLRSNSEHQNPYKVTDASMSPTPNEFNHPAQPDTDHGTWNMGDIANYRIGG